MSNFKVRGNILNVSRNIAHKNGGGLLAESSFLMIQGRFKCANNEAMNEGGFSLMGNSRLYGRSDSNDSVNFTSNRAH